MSIADVQYLQNSCKTSFDNLQYHKTRVGHAFTGGMEIVRGDGTSACVEVEI